MWMQYINNVYYRSAKKDLKKYNCEIWENNEYRFIRIVWNLMIRLKIYTESLKW